MAYVLKIQLKKYLLLELNGQVGNGINNNSRKAGLFVGFFNLKLVAIPVFEEVINTSVYQLRSFCRQTAVHGFWLKIQITVA